MGLDSLVDYYRNTYMIECLNALEKIHSNIKEYKKFENDSIVLYNSRKTGLSTKIRHYYYSFNKNVPSVITADHIPSKTKDVASYSMDNLIKDSESMVKESHINNIMGFIHALDTILDKTPQPQGEESTLNSRAEKVVKGPYSRLSYRLGVEVLNVSI